MAHIKKAETRSKKKMQTEIIAAFENFANISRACKKVGIPRRTFYHWMEEDEFKAAFDKSLKIATGVLEDEATRRAIQGTLKPVFYKGEKVGSIREYSDTLTIVLLKAHAPDKYKENWKGELSGPNGQPIQTESTIIKVYQSGPPLVGGEDEIK